jgi:hypothetical protein
MVKVVKIMHDITKGIVNLQRCDSWGIKAIKTAI